MRYAKKIDANQPNIVNALRSIPGVTVAVNHDDILVGTNKRTFWFEIKEPGAMRKDGKPKAGALRQSQIELLNTWRGHYRVVSTLEQILEEIGCSYMSGREDVRDESAQY